MALPFLILCACVGRRCTPPSSVVGTLGNQELGAGNAIVVMDQCLAHDQFRRRGKRMIEGRVFIFCT